MINYLKPGTLPYLQKLAGVLNKKLVFVDLETTGFVNASNFAIIEVGIVIIAKEGVVEESSLLDPGCRIPSNITELTGITNEMVKGKPTFNKYLRFFEETANDHILLGFNSKSFDSKGIEKIGRQNGRDFCFNNQLDVRYIFNRERNESTGTSGASGKLGDAKRHYSIKLGGDAHRAGYDIALTAIVLEVILQKQGLGYILKEMEKIACKKTLETYRINCTEYCSTKRVASATKATVSPIKRVDDKPKKVASSSGKVASSSRKVASTTKKTVSKNSSSVVEEDYKRKYLEAKKENSGFLGKIFGSLFD